MTATSDRPTLSIVMIAYNVERYLRQAIDSVLAQRVDADYELIIGEDRSTDRTREIVREYAERWPDRIRPILRDVNLGMNRNFMETLQQARGQFIALLDSDDYWTSPDKLQRQLDFLRSHPECSTCFHNTLVIYEDGSAATHPFHTEHPEHLISRRIPKPISTLADLVSGNFMQTCSVMFRAGLYGELPDWYLEMPTFDWPLHVLNAEHGAIGYIDEVLGAYRVHSAGFWSMKMAEYRRIADVAAMIHGYRLIDRHTGGRYRKAIRNQLIPLHRQGAKVQLAHGRRLSALRYLLGAISPRLKAHRRDNRRAFEVGLDVLRTLRPSMSRDRPGH